MVWRDLLWLLPMMAPAFAAIVVMLWGAFRPNQAPLFAVTVTALLFGTVLIGAPWMGSAGRVGELITVDAPARFFWTVLLLGTLMVVLLARGYLYKRQVHGERHHREFYILILLALTGAMTLAASHHFAMAFLGLELLSLALFGLIAYVPTSIRALEAGIKYLLLSGASSALLLFGMALVYAASGSLLVNGLAGEIESAREPFAAAGVALILVGMGFKLSLVPFHMWTPDVYDAAPAPVTSFIASVAKVATAAWLLRFLSESQAWQWETTITILTLLTAASMVIGNLLALYQDNIKRLLAYSSISHFGYMILPLMAASPFAAESMAFYAAAYAATVITAFGVVAAVSESTPNRECVQLAHYRGLFWQRPWAGLAFAVALVSLAGLPLTAGFIAKFYIVATAVEAHLWIPLAALILGSAIGVFFYLRWLLVLFHTGESRSETVTALDSGLLAALGVVVVLIGVLPEPLANVIRVLWVAFE